MKLKKLFSVLLTLALLTCLLPAMAMPAAATEVDDWTELQTALSAGGNVKLTGNVAWPEDPDAVLEIPENTTVTLDLNGHTIDCSYTVGSETAPANVGFNVRGALTLEDNATGGAGLICGAQNAVLVNGGELEFCSGTITAVGDGSLGVRVTSGAFNMSGGEISGVGYCGVMLENEGTEGCLTGGSICGNTHGVCASGASLTLSGAEIMDNDGYGVILIAASSCTMDGGQVSGNGKNPPVPEYDFGNVCVTEGSSFELNAGEISDGGVDGVDVFEGGTVTLSGGSIFGNAAEGVYTEFCDVTMNDCEVYDNYYDGFGVYGGTLIVSGGDVHDNGEFGIYSIGGDVILEDGIIRDNGIAGVRVRGCGRATMTGGSISGNGVTGVFVEEGEFLLSGEPVFSGNGADVALNDGMVITVAGALLNTQPIRVAVETPPEAGKAVQITSGLAGKGKVTRFSAADDAFHIDADEFFEAVIAAEDYVTPGSEYIDYTPTAPTTDENKGDAVLPSPTFENVDPDAWYAGAAAFAEERGIFDGTGEGEFDPNGEMDRGMAVQVLWNLAGKPGAEGEGSFGDVDEADFFAAAAAWAEELGITNGTSTGGFSPDAPVTREMMFTMLYRYLQTFGKGFAGLWAFRLDYPDADQISDWAYEGVCWLVMNDVIQGTGSGIDPQGVLTCAQAAALAERVAALLE